MANTYTLIQAQTLSTTASSVTFSSIPSTYTDLNILLSCRANQAASQSQDIYMRLGSGSVDTGSNYSMTRIYGTGSSTASDRASGTSTALRVGRTTDSSATANTFASNSIYVPGYATANKKQLFTAGVDEDNGAQSFQMLLSGLWNSTTAVDILTIYPFTGGTSFVADSTFYLYGIKNS
jgi:hypothetical protein